MPEFHVLVGNYEYVSIDSPNAASVKFKLACAVK
jgi:hypothetical protein